MEMLIVSERKTGVRQKVESRKEYRKESELIGKKGRLPPHPYMVQRYRGYEVLAIPSLASIQPCEQFESRLATKLLSSTFQKRAPSALTRR
jgi:hypothetical protein